MSKLKKWNVRAICTIGYDAQVMARDYDEAIEKAENLDGAEWTEEDVWCQDWEVTGAEEATK